LKIAFFEVQEWERPFLEKGLADYDVQLFNETLNETSVDQVKDFEVISVFIYSNLNKNIIDKLTKARLIATRSTGFDTLTFKPARAEHSSLQCASLRRVTVAEHTFALILSLSRMIHDSYRELEWETLPAKEFEALI